MKKYTDKEIIEYINQTLAESKKKNYGYAEQTGAYKGTLKFIRTQLSKRNEKSKEEKIWDK